MDVGSQFLDRNLLSTPHHGLPASEIKQTFLSTNLASLLVFEQQAARLPLSVTVRHTQWHLFTYIFKTSNSFIYLFKLYFILVAASLLQHSGCSWASLQLQCVGSVVAGFTACGILTP